MRLTRDSIALEGEGDHSPFTEALLKNLKKPISIDDMFSMVTREVSLVTKGMQRPYKYASLENIVCLTGPCSGATPAPVADVTQEAQRSASDELQVALQTNNPAALQTYLEKYPQSSQREKVLNSAFRRQDCTSAENAPRPPKIPLYGTATFPDGTFGEHTIVIDCKQSIMALADVKAVSPSGQILGAFKWADPDLLNLSMGQAITPGQIADVAKRIVCDKKFRTPLVDKEQVESMSFSDLASTTKGDSEIYYQAMQSEEVPEGQRDTIVVVRPITELQVRTEYPQLYLAPGEDLGTFKTGAYWDRFQCEQRKMVILKTELFDASNNLKHLAVADLSKELAWVEIQDTSPFALLQRILCGPYEVQK